MAPGLKTIRLLEGTYIAHPEEAWTSVNAGHYEDTKLPCLCNEADQPVNPKGHQPWIFIERRMMKLSSNTLATWCEEQTH